MTNEIKFTLKELKDFMEYRGKDGVEYFNANYHTINEFCNGLCTSATDGLCDKSDIEYRRNIFGRNIYRDQISNQMINVIRSSQHVTIPAEELVVGDIIFVKVDDRIPADAVLIESNELATDESMLTGESESVKMGDGVNIQLLSGSKVVNGNGKCVVIAVGVNSCAFGLLYFESV